MPETLDDVLPQPAQQEPAAAGDAHQHLVVVVGAPRQQGLQGGSLHLDRTTSSGIGAADDLLGETV